jgi:hypothetical protein
VPWRCGGPSIAASRQAPPASLRRRNLLLVSREAVFALRQARIVGGPGRATRGTGPKWNTELERLL